MAMNCHFCAIKAYIRKAFFASPRDKNFPKFWIAISPSKRRGCERLDFGQSGRWRSEQATSAMQPRTGHWLEMPLNGCLYGWQMRTPDPQRKLRQAMVAICLASDSSHFYFCDLF
jgi:hypothetical protein